MEFELIKHLMLQSGQSSHVTLGIGDDCAILPGSPTHDYLISTDTLMDGVHFQADRHPLEMIARKVIAVSVSDIAAMAGIPRSAFVGVSLPRSWSYAQAKDFMGGIITACQEFDVNLSGGDTTTWDHPLAVTSTVIGQVDYGKAVLRSGAQVGDLVCVSGPLGGSLLGKHFSFVPRVKEANWILENLQPTAMIDISDGLLADLQHILDQSSVGACLQVSQIPISEAAMEMIDHHTALEHALHDGEDFELLWTMPAEKKREIERIGELPLDIYVIGAIRETPGCLLQHLSGEEQRCETKGYQHQLNDHSDD